MARRRRTKPITPEKPLYTEKIPMSLMPRRLLRGKRWGYFETLGRFLGLFLLILAVLSLIYQTEIMYPLVFLIGALLVFYTTDVISPNTQRTIRPIRIYSTGVLVYTSGFEKFIGKKSFLTPSDLKGIDVIYMDLQTETGREWLPTHLTFVLKSGMKIKMGRRNCTELQTIIPMIKNLGIEEL